ncbi:hypothetical protein PILCRDRAFT_768369 [Piloderma croceum F 1598]|uniref:Ras GEF n=1 Tax=Piloderma croceum (strain F 1598) TaxID=765440 RepID=A0A0C3GER4_PILCF|nr:hypothetical protein PILCRDRAFT_768369 [Piloderma croceum F 1598]
MHSNRLQINTKGAGPSSSKGSPRERSPTPGLPRRKKSFASNAANGRRLRTVSNASSSSTMSIISPSSSSSNESGSYVRVAQGRSSLDSTSSAPTSPMLEDTVRVSSEYVLAMHDFSPQLQDANCLSFRAGQVIHVLNRDDSGWWDGELDGQRGWFPSNYVNVEAGEMSLTEEDLPMPTRRQFRHGHSLSATSWTSTTHRHPHNDHRPLVSETLGSDIDSYCPPLMLPLLQGISVLQSAVRSNRMAHFEASTACIISRVKAVLAHTECLVRDSRLLKEHQDLWLERKAMLADLAALVQQTREAVSDTVTEVAREAVIEEMLKTGGQIFSHTRRFLAIAVQCGVDLSDGAMASDFGDSVNAERRWSGEDMFPPTDSTPTDYDSVVPLLPHRNYVGKSKKDQYWLRGRVNGGHKPGADSTSSTSSYGSLDHPKPAIPPLPQGPSTTPQVMEALRRTHDHYLSTIAAFIGHAHSYARFSHASTTGKMYELVGEIVEMVCRLLTIVEAVMRIPGIPAHKHSNLKSAKEGLYNVTSALADSVQQLASDLPVDSTEEDEKSSLLRSATGALKAGADCVAAVKVTLNRSVGEKSFIIYMPIPGDATAVPFTPSKFSKAKLGRSLSSSALSQFGGDDEDFTIQAQAQLPQDSAQKGGDSSDGSDDSIASTRASHETNGTSPDETKPPPPALQIFVERDQPSPTSFVPLSTQTDDDRSTWAGSQDHHRAGSMEDKISNGSLPSVPSANQHLEDPMSWIFAHEYPKEDIAYNSEGLLVGATLNVLVTKMTPHDSIVDAVFSAVFFLTFRLFASPIEFVDALVARYNIMPPPGAQEHEQHEWQQRKGIPIRMRVTNIIKQWVETYWRPTLDNVVIPVLSSFVRDALSPMFPSQCKRILEVITARENASDPVSPKGDRIRDPGMSINPPSLATSEVPRPTMTKTLLAALRSKNFASILITDFDALELARQMTIMENNLYLAIQPSELLETGQQGVKSPLTVKAVSSLSTTITGWVAESILDEHDIKKRTALIKFFIKVADRCTTLNNFSTPRSILAALDSSTISRLNQTWLGLPQKNRMQLEALRRLADHGRNYHEYRSRLKETAPPGVPFLGLYLTDVTFCREGNPNFRASPGNPAKKLLNFNKYHKLARIVQDMQRFQVPYNLKAIPEVQEYLNGAFEKAKHHGDLQDLYRRSLLVEPKQPADTLPGPPTSDMRQLFSWATRSQPQQPSPVHPVP